MKKILLITLTTLMTLTLTGCGNSDTDGLDTDNKTMVAAGYWIAENHAITDIQNEALVTDTLKSSEISCEAIGVAEKTIVVVKCSTSNEQLIKHYGSETIYYGFQKSASGDKYWHYASNSRDEAIEKAK